MDTIILKMSNTYDYQDFYKQLPSDSNVIIEDFSMLQGTNCYLDDTSYAVISQRLKVHSYQSLHYIDSGNYHYLSLLWLEKIPTDFNLLLFDHHPDNQLPSFGDIISCGGWVLNAQNRLNNLKNVYTFGIGNDPDLTKLPVDIPIYISIDKDILSKDYAITDWDQGDMSIEALLDSLSQIINNRKIIGIDICGDSSQYAREGAQINNKINRLLFDFINTNF